jgi:acetyl-CoA carboxylase biotin carboxylase subunit
MNKKINKILVANRGEIAVRIIRTCKELGISTVAIYSEVDQNAYHVRMADECYSVGAAPVRESYLNQNKIIEIAMRSNVTAIHPGYGFLSENPGFVELVNNNDLIFIGPGADAIRLMGDKTAARELASSLGIPIVPGTTKPLSSVDEAIEVANKLTYPILLKASGGGGGKGMRIINSDAELASGMRASQSEAESAFNDNRIYIEKYIENPRHIEVQILADNYGNVIHLGERECSIQRRHQKIVEESPSPFINEPIREKLTQTAIRLVKHSGYTNAGTVEFIFDQEKNFYYLEMNTRLQVEHPVTEMRIGFDIVREQISIAEGKPLTITQKDILFRGHAIECRIYAEDPANNFYPSTGRIHSIKSPQGLGVREDCGVQDGDEITTYYDPIISKLIAWGNTRDEARLRMIAALQDYELFGVRNNIALCIWIMNHQVYSEGIIDTNFLHRYFKPEMIEKYPDEILSIAAITIHKTEKDFAIESSAKPRGNCRSTWKNNLTDYMR